MNRLLTIFLLCSFGLAAQQPQTHTAPIVRENAKWANGVAPGYAPSAGASLTLNLSAGTAFCGGSVITYAGGTLSMTGSTTNNVYLDTASTCAPAVKTSGFSSTDIPIAVVTTTSSITAISDIRTMMFPPGISGSGACPTCVTSAASLGSTEIMTGAGSQASQTPSSAATLDGSGNFAGASLLASGIIDGTVPVTVTTSTPITVGATYRSGYFDNQHATAATAITYNLPTAAAGRSYCFVNSYNGSAMDTGTITLQTSASGQYIIDGALSATGGYVISSGAASDAGCVRGVDSTHWQFYPQGGTWVLH